MYRIGRSIIRPYLRLRYRPVISGLENIPQAGPVLLVSNHLASLDTLLIPSFSSRKVHFLAKESLFKTRFRKWIMASIGAVPVQRDGAQAAQAALEAGKTVLQSGHVFAVFPEGTRSTTGLLNSGKPGAAWLALETQAAVVPIGLIGTNRKQNVAKSRIEMRVGTPVNLRDLGGVQTGKNRREATERIMQAIAALSGQQRNL